MNSCLYNCTIAHRRSSPKKHAFKYKIFMFYLDLDELDKIDQGYNLIARNRFAPYEFRDTDHYHRGSLSIRESIKIFIKEQGVNTPIGKIHLLTHLRTWGHVFNPVSFYFVADSNGRPLCNIAEVGNTFNEQKMYLLPADINGFSKTSRAKRFYVSPFSDLDTTFDFRLSLPNERLRLCINQSQNGKTYFGSALSGHRLSLSDLTLALYIFRFPLLTLTIVFAIHWQAMLLFLKKVPVRRKAANPHLQTDTRPYLVRKKHLTH